MEQNKQDFIDALILLIDDAEQDGIPYSFMIVQLQEAVRDVRERANHKRGTEQ